ncbi:MAG: DUF4037 domain-containing protein [Armatimonas sp.]
MFYTEAVRPILDAEFPGLSYSAALIGAGSEVLGYDTPMSMDHDWGPRLLLFLAPQNYATLAQPLTDTLSHKLPPTFHGHAVGTVANDNGTLRFEAGAGPLQHRVVPLTISAFFQGYLNFDIDTPISPADWFTFPSQKLRTLTRGAIYHDGLGLKEILARFAYYPHDVWLYRLASGWHRIGQEEHLMGRAGYVGDELGSAVIASRLVRDLMNLCFLMERQYTPYPKWFGTAFNELSCAPDLTPHLLGAQQSATWQEREKHLVAAYEYVAVMHNALSITEPLPTKVGLFFDRPFQVIHQIGGFAEALCQRITDPEVQRIASHKLIGNIDQWSDSTDILEDTTWRDKLLAFYQQP